MFGMLSIFPHIYWRWVEKEYIALFILLNHALLMAEKKKSKKDCRTALDLYNANGQERKIISHGVREGLQSLQEKVTTGLVLEVYIYINIYKYII